MNKWIFVITFCILTIPAHVAHGICCEKIKELVKRKQNAYRVLCGNGHNLPRYCCEDIRKEVKTFVESYTTLCLNRTDSLYDSRILRGKYNWIIQIRKWLPSNLTKKNTVRCYQGTVNGWASRTFHNRCDYKGPTLVIVQRGSYVFGAFASKSWGGRSRYIRTSTSFIFSLKNKDGLSPFKTYSTVRPQFALYTSINYGPTFGGGHDIYIANNARLNSYSYTNFGYSYKAPNGYSYGSTKIKNLLAGSYRFSVNEVEVYYFSS